MAAFSFLLSPPSSVSLPNPLSSLSSLSLSPFPLRRRLPLPLPPPPLTVRSGGGPRTFPGGLTKLQWKRMQAKKAKQHLKARVLRERQLHDKRRRSELKAALVHLEKPWEETPGGLDTWSDRDGPRVFRRIAGGDLPTASFFPEGAVHSVGPYGGRGGGDGPEVLDDWTARGGCGAGSEDEGEEGVRPNAYAEGSGSAMNNVGTTPRPTDYIVDAEVVDDRGEGVRRNSSERDRYGMINRWGRGEKNDGDGATLRATSDPYTKWGPWRNPYKWGLEEIGDSKWNSGASGSSRNNRRSK